MSRHVLVARLDSIGDVLLTGPAIRAIAGGADRVTVLCGRRGEPAARLLPGVDDVMVWTAPWIDPEPAALDASAVQALVDHCRTRGFSAGVIVTSFHQSPLPLALLLRMAGVNRLAAISEDYPGSLLDVRHHVPAGVPEAERALSLATAAGFALPGGDDGRLRVRAPLPDTRRLTGSAPYVVVHPGTSVPARAWSSARHAALVRLLAAAGIRAVVTGSADERALTAHVAGAHGTDIGGRTDLAQLAAVLAGAHAVVVGNTGTAHLAAAVGTPVVSLFAPTVPASQWRPYGVRHVLLGDQQAACRDSRARACPVPGHPCLDSVTPDEVFGAVRGLIDDRRVETGAA